MKQNITLALDREVLLAARVFAAQQGASVSAMLAEQVFDETAVPIWEQLSAIGESSPEGTWDAVPTDLSMKIDDLVYRHDSGVR
jgi:hypothetical protein